MLAFAASGHVPTDLEPLDEDTFLCEWVDGVTLDRSSGETGDLLRRCGAVLRALHAVALPAFAFMPITERAGPQWFERDMGGRLPGKMVELARGAGARLCSYRERDSVLLHGDCVPWNVLVAFDRIVFVDPIGFVGPAAWDVAQLAIALPGRDRRENMAAILGGYGSTPPLIEAAFAYMAFMFFAKNLELEEEAPGTRGRFLVELGELCETLIPG
jgi:Ser/Thr protein kinase RdoA (MazF antagonist)